MYLTTCGKTGMVSSAQVYFGPMHVPLYSLLEPLPVASEKNVPSDLAQGVIRTLPTGPLPCNVGSTDMRV